MSTKYVGYIRVSTQKQGQSGLGLEAQRRDIDAFIRSTEGAELIGEYQDVESGRHDDRPQLAEAIRMCKLKGATLLVAKLDRLARKVSFLEKLQGLRFVALDCPSANQFTLTILMALAQEEARLISVRTKAALAAAKARGVRLGGVREGAFNGCSGTEGRAAQAKAAQERAELMKPTLLAMENEGLSLRQMAKRLTEDGFQTARGGAWTAANVRNLLARITR